MTEPGRTLVVGIGNTLRGDDGAGVHALRSLRARAPEDGGTIFHELEGSHADLLPLLEEADRLIVIDTELSARAGEMRRWVVERSAAGEGRPAYSTHQLGLARVLEMAEGLGLRTPGSVIVHALAIAPSEEFSTSLSETMRARLGAFVERIEADLSRSRERAAGTQRPPRRAPPTQEVHHGCR